MRRATAGVVIAMAVLGAGVARGDEAEREYEFSVDGKLGPSDVAELDGAAGPVTLGQVFVQNVPGEREVQEARERDRARPKPVLVVSHAGPRAAALSLELRFEDEQGAVLMSCSLQTHVKQGWNELVEKICVHEDMPLRDWRRVQVVRVKGKVRG